MVVWSLSFSFLVDSESYCGDNGYPDCGLDYVVHVGSSFLVVAYGFWSTLSESGASGNFRGSLGPQRRSRESSRKRTRFLGVSASGTKILFVCTGQTAHNAPLVAGHAGAEYTALETKNPAQAIFDFDGAFAAAEQDGPERASDARWAAERLLSR